MGEPIVCSSVHTGHMGPSGIGENTLLFTLVSRIAAFFSRTTVCCCQGEVTSLLMSVHPYARRGEVKLAGARWTFSSSFRLASAIMTLKTRIYRPDL